MEKIKLEVGDVVQINPEFHFGDKKGFFGGCLMIVTDPKEWGAQGFIAIPQQRGEPPGTAFYRAKWEEMEFIGKAEWGPEIKDEK